jgi:hypothetical protein
MWDCNSDNAGKLCDKDTDDWYCNDENLGKKCYDVVGGYLPNGSDEGVVTTGTDIFARIDTPTLAAGTVVGSAAVWGAVKYTDNDDDPAPAPRNPSPNR